MYVSDYITDAHMHIHSGYIVNSYVGYVHTCGQMQYIMYIHACIAIMIHLLIYV